MSDFISHMPCAGLIETPPVSKVMPLPTRATRLPVPRPRPARRTASPAAAAPSEPMPDGEDAAVPPAASAFSSSTSTLEARPRRAAAATASANAGGRRSLGAVFTQSRVRATARATTVARVDLGPRRGVPRRPARAPRPPRPGRAGSAAAWSCSRRTGSSPSSAPSATARSAAGGVLVVGEGQRQRDPLPRRRAPGSPSGGAAQRLRRRGGAVRLRAEPDGGDQRGGDGAERGELDHLAWRAGGAEQCEGLGQPPFEGRCDALRSAGQQQRSRRAVAAVAAAVVAWRYTPITMASTASSTGSVSTRLSVLLGDVTRLLRTGSAGRAVRAGDAVFGETYLPDPAMSR